MYNRYIRRDDGTYTKVAEPEPPRQETADHGSVSYTHLTLPTNSLV